MESVAIAPVEQIKGFISNLETLLMPKIAAGNERDFRSVLLQRYAVLFLLSFVIVGGYIFCAPIFFRVAFPAYPQAVFYSQIFVISLANLTFFPAGTYLRAKGKIREQYLSSVLSSIFQITVMVVCVVQWGIVGLLVARILSRWSATLFNVYLLHRLSRDA
jgi:O-antigen/teichoic acid export membrane protein